jgi:uncharacterized protein (DUF983 family)
VLVDEAAVTVAATIAVAAMAVVVADAAHAVVVDVVVVAVAWALVIVWIGLNAALSLRHPLKGWKVNQPKNSHQNTNSVRTANPC